MKRCAFCGAEVAMHAECRTGCPSCLAAYRADIAAGKIPAGLSPEAYTFDFWKYIRQLERDVVAGRISEVEAHVKVNKEAEIAKKNYARQQVLESGERSRLEALEKEQEGPTGFLV